MLHMTGWEGGKVFHVSPSRVKFKLKFNARKRTEVRNPTNEFKLFTGCQVTEQNFLGGTMTTVRLVPKPSIQVNLIY